MGRGRNGKNRAHKASARATRGGGTEVAISPQVAAGSNLGGPASEWFGPGRPMQPMAPASTAGRRMDFQFGTNLQTRPRFNEPVSFQQLRMLADNHDITRLAIETRKDQMSRLEFSFAIIDSQDDLNDEQKARATRYRQLFRRPDGENFWQDWLRMVLEDLLVIDAPSIFIQRTRDKEDIVGLYQIDGATVKPIIDNLGRTPQPPEAAYQQVLHGMPAINYSTRELIYRPRNKRVHTIWGFSPVEQIIALVNIALRRQLWQHAYFTNGNVPDSLIGVPDTWSPDQIREFQDNFDNQLSGNTDRRRGAIFVPGSVAKSYVPTKDAEMFGAAEEWLARVVCYCFGLSHQALIKEVNRATSDNAREQALEEGLAPIMGYVKSLIDGILLDHFGETELEFRWVQDKEIDPKVLDEIWKGRVDNGTASRNEHRTGIGLEPRPEPEADMLTTASTVTPLAVEDSITQQKARQDSGVFPTPPEPGAEPGQEPAAGGKQEVGKPKPKPKPKPGEEPPAGKAAKAASDDPRYKKLAVSRKPVERQRKKIEKAVAAALKRIGGRVVTAIEAKISAAKAAADDRAEMIEVALAAIGTWEFLFDPTAEALEIIAEDAVREAAAMIGSLDGALVDQVSELAVGFARQRAAELIGKRVLENGQIVDNPAAQWAIDETTRTMIRDTITRVLAENEGSGSLVSELQDAYAFSPERALMISRTEVANANSRAAMETYRGAREAGVALKKEWLIGPESCDICLENADAGAIDLDEDFPSGDSESPAHPNCTCATAPVVDEEQGAEGTE